MSRLKTSHVSEDCRQYIFAKYHFLYLPMLLPGCHVRRRRIVRFCVLLAKHGVVVSILQRKISGSGGRGDGECTQYSRDGCVRSSIGVQQHRRHDPAF